MRRRVAGTVAVALQLCAGVPALAEGEMVQLQLSGSDLTGVVVAERGRISYGATVHREDGATSTKLSLQYSWRTEGKAPWVFRLGPMLRVEGRDLGAGVQAGVERYLDLGSGGLFLLAEHGTIDSASFGLVSWRDYASGLGIDATLYKEKGERSTPAVSATWRIRPPLTVQAGYRFREDEAFLGMTWSSF